MVFLERTSNLFPMSDMQDVMLHNDNLLMQAPDAGSGPSVIDLARENPMPTPMPAVDVIQPALAVATTPISITASTTATTNDGMLKNLVTNHANSLKAQVEAAKATAEAKLYSGSINPNCNDVQCMTKALFDSIDPEMAQLLQTTSNSPAPTGTQSMAPTATPPAPAPKESNMMPWLIGGALALYLVIKTKGAKKSGGTLSGVKQPKTKRKATATKKPATRRKTITL